MIEIHEKYQCCGCNACVQACPKECISMCADEEGFFYPVFQKEKCIQCEICVSVCPILQKTETTGESRKPKAYAAFNLNDDVRFASSSGGVFSVLAEHVLSCNGAVYGAAMIGTLVKHIRVTRLDELSLLRGSKYVQSRIGWTYRMAKEDLQNGKQVLFTGTPCQIEGLRSFLRREYRNLITLDFICHGVPSPLVWEKYVSWREKVAGMPVERAYFRHKKHGWKSFSVMLEFADKTAKNYRFYDDPFMSVFLQNLCLRPSCYQCSFKKKNRFSDITVADLWGSERLCPEIDDDKGLSLVSLHTQKGTDLLSALFDKLCYREIDFDEAIQYNSAMIRSVNKNKFRDEFMEKIDSESFEKLAKKYAKKRMTPLGFVRNGLEKVGLLGVARKIRNMLR